LAVSGIETQRGRERRSVTLARLEEDKLVSCGAAGSGLTDRDLTEIRAALAERVPVIAEIDQRARLGRRLHREARRPRGGH
jgi:hypothetical protein